ncbi:hypothetical protein GW819_00370 [Candidatus Gracilibacteria bacterium]|nr:hypothetical protein [bacterium]NDK19278.1 hypothetical protein [Candidatus Gracilibacteria bacterium]OIO76599.1 MAG: hypothetical protein AUJ87_02480 [Candidatus Gracilibacteria bacterium CG1_02_38_174]PIQ10783.1 MAG: hypothetical protein COW68_03855 [Candidatus Gracilibacteria bacterium CG18_big_fil_WC_8_21_14_2_50_38_16]PIQ42055.1 MAG: hypothetical protein COW06_00930 [Candidatus Gracilibacteria bacterium CG12_big_fil_rev_8_21_14_0_65_38_15]PIZ01889.1 MAG: hypothetical protein COY60_0119
MTETPKSLEQSSGKPKNSTEHATDAIKNIQSLAGNIDIDKAFPRMKELMNTQDNEKTFSKISEMSQICKGQNGAVDRKKMTNLCAVIDQEARS